MGLIIAVIMGVIASLIANSKGRSVVGWFFGGFFLSLIGVIIVAVLPNLNEQRARDEQRENENRRLREQLRQERLKSEAFRSHTMMRLDAHDEHLGLNTRALSSDNLGRPLLANAAPTDPAHALEQMSQNAKWYYENAGESNGPLSHDELVELMQLGMIRRDTLVWNENLVQWTPAEQINTLRTHLPS